MQIGVLQFGTAQFVVGHLDVGLLLTFLTETLVETMPVIEHIVGGHDEHQQDQQQDDGNALVLLRLLHGATIVGQRGIGTQFLEELRVYLVIICIERPLVERQGCHCTLVADVEDDLVVGVNAIVQPLNLSRGAIVALSLQQQLTIGVLLLIMGIQAGTTRVGKL